MSEENINEEAKLPNASAAENVVQETLKLVEQSQSQGVFSLSEVIKGRGYPTKEVTIYLDGESAFELAELNDEMLGYFDDSIVEQLEKKAEVLVEKIKKSAVTFVMRGVSQKIVEDVIKKVNEKITPPDGRREYSENDQWIKLYISSLVALNIVKAIDADGNVDEHQYSAEEMLELRELMAADSWNTLVETMQKLTLASGYFEQLTDAGFLPRS